MQDRVVADSQTRPPFQRKGICSESSDIKIVQRETVQMFGV
jgi:hypothetical protein